MDIQVKKDKIALVLGQTKVTLQCTNQEEAVGLAFFLTSQGYTHCIVGIETDVLPFNDEEPEFV